MPALVRLTGGNGGSYDYFVCRGKQLGSCSQSYRRTDVVEAKLIQHYATIRLSDARREKLRTEIRSRFAALTAFSAQELERAKTELSTLMDQERKLLRAHYEDRISKE